MALADGAKAENKAQAAGRAVRLVRVRHDAGIEQRRGFERIFVQKISADQLALNLGKRAVSRQRLFHDVGSGLERLQQVAMPALKIFQHVGQQMGCDLRVECKDALDDMIGAGLVGRVEIAWLSRGLERAYN